VLTNLVNAPKLMMTELYHIDLHNAKKLISKIS